MPVEPSEFKKALGQFGSGVTVLTAVGDDGTDHGMTASAFSSLSLDPPLVLVCVKKAGNMHEHMSQCSGFGISILAASQQELSNRFAGYPPMDDRFADLAVDRAPGSGAAWLQGALARLDCQMHAQLDGGDHTIFCGRVEGIDVAEGDDKPLIYWSGGYRDLTNS